MQLGGLSYGIKGNREMGHTLAVLSSALDSSEQQVPAESTTKNVIVLERSVLM